MSPSAVRVIDYRWYDVTTYGAVGDGIADDTAAWQAAITAGAGKIIYVPYGKYRLTSTLVLPSGTTIRGTSHEYRGDCWIQFDAVNDSLFFIGENIRDIVIENLYFESDLANTNRLIDGQGNFPNSSYGFNFNNIGALGFDRVISMEALDGAGAWQCDHALVSHCWFYGNNYSIWHSARNADYWLVQDCTLAGFIAAVHIDSHGGGFMTFDTCAGTGHHTGKFFELNTSSGQCTFVFIDTQAESVTYYMTVNGATSTYDPITLIGCIIDADITLDAPCKFTSIGCRYDGDLIANPSYQIDIASISDGFHAGHTISASGLAVKTILVDGHQLLSDDVAIKKLQTTQYTGLNGATPIGKQVLVPTVSTVDDVMTVLANLGATRNATAYTAKVLALDAPNLIGAWDFSDGGPGVADVSLKGRNGTGYNCTFGAIGIGDGGTAIAFNGSTSYVDLFTAALAADFDGNTGRLSFWAKTASWADGIQAQIFMLSASGSGDYYEVVKNSTANQLIAVQHVGGISHTISNAMSPAGWFHVGLTWDAGTMELYINGISVGTVAIAPWVNAPTAIRFGKWGGAFNGSGAELALWTSAGVPGDMGTLATVP